MNNYSFGIFCQLEVLFIVCYLSRSGTRYTACENTWSKFGLVEMKKM